MTTATESRLKLSDLAPDTIQSEIRAMTVACAAMPGGINMAQGVCDTDPPVHVVEDAIQAIRDGHNIYVRMDGIEPLRAAIAQKMASYNKLPVNPDTEVLVTSGTTGGMHAACMALLNPGDEVIVLEPFYGYHANTIQTVRAKPVVVSLQAPDWRLDVSALRKAITPRTRAIVINSPGNPSGAVHTRAELEQIAEVAIANDLFVLSDEIYEYFLYDGLEHLSIATLPGMRERTITLSGFSKTFSITGWRLGYLTADPRWIPAIGYFHDLLYVCAPSPLQYGALAGLLALPPSYYQQVAADHQKKRAMLLEALAAAGIPAATPPGSYYALADSTRVPGADARERARNLMKATGVASVAGSAFFAGGRGEKLLRFCFAKKNADLAEACQRLRAY